MAKQATSPIAKTARLLDLVPFITTHQGISIKDLATEFAITTEELLDDLNTLWMCGLPGYTPLELIDLSFESGYVSIRNAEILQKVRLLTKEELVVIAIGLDFLKESLSKDREDLLVAITSLQNKIKSLIGDIAQVTPTVDSAHRAIILRALKERKNLEIDYHSLIRDQISTRVVTPLELGEDKGIEVLLAHCSTASGFRTFRLDNVKQAKLLDTSEFVAETRNASEEIFRSKCRVNSRLRTTFERFRLEADMATSAGLLSGEGITVEVTSFSQDWLVRNFMSTLANTEIMGPTELAKSVGAKARTTLELYKNGHFSS
jgi:proteasome accessory factor C